MPGRNDQAIVIGSGLGGLIAAGFLAKARRPVVVLEALDLVGGRFTHLDYEGFAVPTGAFHALPGGAAGPLYRCFRLLGLAPPLASPTPSFYVQLEGRRYALDLSQGPHSSAPLRSVLGLPGKGRLALTALGALLRMSWGGDPSIAQALTRFGAQPAALTVFDHLTKFSLGVPVEEASLADLACSLWAQRFGREGFLCQGNRGLCSDLVGVIEAAGGTVQTQRPVRRILMEGGRAVGVETEAGEVLRGRPVISNAGAAHTATLLGDATPGWFRQRLEAAVPALGVAHSVRSRQPLHDHSSIEIPCDLPHISGMAPISRLCPALAPPEWHYTLAYQALDRRLPLDEQVDAGVRELQGHFGSGAEVFNSALYRGTHPAAALAQSVGQHGGARFPLGVPEIRDLHLVGHDVAGHGIAAEVIGSSCLRLRRVLR